MEFKGRARLIPQIACPWCSAQNDVPDDDRREIHCVACGYTIDVPAARRETPEDQRLRDLGAPTLPGLERC